MKCTKCGTELPYESKFCPECGERIIPNSDEVELNNKKKKVSKPLVLAIIGVICLLIVGISLLVIHSSSDKIRVPRSLNSNTSAILGSDAKLFDDCFRAFVEAYNTREEGDGGLLNETDEFNNLKSQLKYIGYDSIEKKEIITDLQETILIIWFSDATKTIRYSDSGRLEKGITTQEQIDEAEKYIHEIIDKYYK